MAPRGKVLVTGATGFIGKSLCKYLFEAGYSVTGSVRDVHRANNYQKNVLIDTLDASTDWTKALRDCDVVIHLAGRAHILNSKNINNIDNYRENNTEATLNLAKQAVELGVSRFIFLSSIGVNGISTNGLAFKPNDRPSTHSPYTKSKLEAEIGLKLIGQESKMQIVIIRSPAVYGIGAPGNFGLIEKLIRYNIPMPFGCIKNKRSLISLGNLLELLLLSIESKKVKNQLYLVCDNEDFSTPDIVRLMGKIICKKPIIFNFPVKLLLIFFYLIRKEKAAQSLISDLQVDNQLAINDLGWKPRRYKKGSVLSAPKSIDRKEIK
jgi:nucleoside-diphosphate-sugar epimerase